MSEDKAPELAKELSVFEINKIMAAHQEKARLENQNSDEAIRNAAARAMSIPTTPVLIEATPAAARKRMDNAITAAKAKAAAKKD